MPPGALAFLVFGDKGDKSEGTRAAILGHVEGVSVELIDEVAERILPRLTDRVRPESTKLLQMHNDAGRETWIVSASPYGIVAPLADTLEMTGAIATKGKVFDGHYTAELDGPFVYGAGKAEAIENLARERATTSRRPTPIRIRFPICRCSSWSAIRWRSTQTAGSRTSPTTAAGRW